MKETVPVFILGSGRSGTLQMVKLLEQIDGIESHHEYLFENILKTAVLYRMGRADIVDVKNLLHKTHLPAIFYSKSKVWVDSSNALPWIVKPLYEIFPNARFIHLVRDGRKVVSSFYHKFTEEMYRDENVAIFQQWLASPHTALEPPPEKKYWRPIPLKSEKFFNNFESFDRFERLCYYWRDCNLWIKDALALIPEDQKLTIHLEDVVSNEQALSSFLNLFGITGGEKYLHFLKRPVNVAIPKNFLLSNEELMKFQGIAGDAMKTFGYESDREYSVEY